MDIDEGIRTLEESPIYAMSLGSKELFHSNFWAWLMRRNPEFIKTFFPKFRSQKPSVEREEKHRDITIHTEKGSKNDKIYIIENKIKSLPTDDQLKKYSESKGFEKGILTGMQKKMPESIKADTAENWEFLSYGEIADRIYQKIDLLEDNDKIITELYCDMLKKLCAIISDKLDNSKQNEWNFDDADELESINFDDVYKKLKAEILMQEIEKQIDIKDGAMSDNFTFKVEKDFSSKNKMPLISFKFVYGDKNRIKDIYSFGIQIEGDSFRRYAETKKGVLNKIGYDDFFEKFAECGWLSKDYQKGEDLKFTFSDGKECGYNTNMTPVKSKNKTNKNGMYNTFGDFIYQFYCIKDNLEKVESLISQINDNIQYAKSICRDVEKIFQSF